MTKRTARLINIFMVVVIDMTGFGLIMPLLPYYAEQFNATPLVIGLLVASFAAASLLGAPLMGRLSDRYGRRPILLFSVAGTFIGYLLLGFAPSIGQILAIIFNSHAVNAFTIATIFLGRIIDGLTAGNTSVAQAYISDVTDEADRSRGLGLLGSAFGLGFIIGPAVGGLLSRGSYSYPAFVAAILAFLNLVSIFFFLPESLTAERRALIMHKQPPSVTYRALATAIRRPKVAPLLLLRFFIMLAYTAFWSVFALFAQSKLKLNPQSTGVVMAYIGLYSVLVQGMGIGLLTRRFKDNTIISISLWLLFLGLVGWSLTSNLPVMLLVILPLAGGAWTLNTILTSAITKAVQLDEIGGMLGISAASDSTTRMVAPAFGGYMLGTNAAWELGMLSASLILLTTLFAYWRIILVNDPVELQPADV